MLKIIYNKKKSNFCHEYAISCEVRKSIFHSWLPKPLLKYAFFASLYEINGIYIVYIHSKNLNVCYVLMIVDLDSEIRGEEDLGKLFGGDKVQPRVPQMPGPQMPRNPGFWSQGSSRSYSKTFINGVSTVAPKGNLNIHMSQKDFVCLI